MTVFAVLFVGASAFAQNRTLECSPGRDSEKLIATLDDSHFDQGSGLFDVEDAHYLDNYLTMNLTCTGHTLDGIDCIGFANESSAQVEEVAIQNECGLHVAVLTSLKGEAISPHDGLWRCRIK